MATMGVGSAAAYKSPEMNFLWGRFSDSNDGTGGSLPGYDRHWLLAQTLSRQWCLNGRCDSSPPGLDGRNPVVRGGEERERERERAGRDRFQNATSRGITTTPRGSKGTRDNNEQCRALSSSHGHGTFCRTKHMQLCTMHATRVVSRHSLS